MEGLFILKGELQNSTEIDTLTKCYITVIPNTGQY